ncbi:ABC transporter permease [Usitatibacter palustris]|uniref:Uncharacterized protein n=1 Tax=Usitatibacter palustris TaxID=2732487 RepID=A0A6M4HF62_9PROT|nr:ABC transporter permease [Usitatibacter palustris]QJR16687.1 hypothetical protein DSM104440_03523 [Usitatibacter palustris]
MKTQPLYWSLRREIWEHKGVWVAPISVAVLVTVGVVISMVRHLDKFRAMANLDPAKLAPLIYTPFSIIASIILLISFIVGAFYCLDAMNAERRDRSILFWKSLPVSDLTAVTAKALIPLVVLPAIGFVVALTTQIVVLLASSVAFSAKGIDVGILWGAIPLFKMAALMFYGVVVHVLWYAPLHGYFLLVSTLAKRAVFLWATLPPFALVLVEMVTFDVSSIANLIRYRFVGAMQEAWVVDAGRQKVTEFSQIDPVKFLSTPGLWLGLIFAAACFAAVVRLRRSREPA